MVDWIIKKLQAIQFRKKIKKAKKVLYNERLLNVTEEMLSDEVKMNNLAIDVLIANGIMLNGTKMRLVPECDYKAFKEQRLRAIQGFNTFTESPQLADQIDKTNKTNEVTYAIAEILNKFYGVSEEEILQLSGCVLNTNKNKGKWNVCKRWFK